MNQTQYLVMKLKAAEATIQRVRDLHRKNTPVDGDPTDEDWCVHCTEANDGMDGISYPCPTIQTLGDQK